MRGTSRYAHNQLEKLAGTHNDLRGLPCKRFSNFYETWSAIITQDTATIPAVTLLETNNYILLTNYKAKASELLTSTYPDGHRKLQAYKIQFSSMTLAY